MPFHIGSPQTAHGPGCCEMKARSVANPPPAQRRLRLAPAFQPIAKAPPTARETPRHADAPLLHELRSPLPRNPDPAAGQGCKRASTRLGRSDQAAEPLGTSSEPRQIARPGNVPRRSEASSGSMYSSPLSHPRNWAIQFSLRQANSIFSVAKIGGVSVLTAGSVMKSFQKCDKSNGCNPTEEPGGERRGYDREYGYELRRKCQWSLLGLAAFGVERERQKECAQPKPQRSVRYSAAGNAENDT